MKKNKFFHGLKASFTFLLSHTFFLKILLFSCRLSLVCTKYVTNRKWQIVLLRDNLLFVKNYCNDSPRIFRKVFPCVKIIKENNELSSCRPWFSDFLVVYYAGPCAVLYIISWNIFFDICNLYRLFIFALIQQKLTSH